MAQTVTDFLWGVIGGSVTVLTGKWVRLHHNVTAADLFSTAITDSNGQFTVSAVPHGLYSLYYGLSATVGGTPTLVNPNYPVGPLDGTTQSGVTNPAGTTNTTTGVMMGLGYTYTPTYTGNVEVNITFDSVNSGGVNDGALFQLRYGTGAAPANAGAVVGTALGGNIDFVSATVNERAPVALSGVAKGLTLGTTYWFDVQLTAVGGGTATIQDVSGSLQEV